MLLIYIIDLDNYYYSIYIYIIHIYIYIIYIYYIYTLEGRAFVN